MYYKYKDKIICNDDDENNKNNSNNTIATTTTMTQLYYLNLKAYFLP